MRIQTSLDDRSDAMVDGAPNLAGRGDDALSAESDLALLHTLCVAPPVSLCSMAWPVLDLPTACASGVLVDGLDF
jgi:hypothetical protein